LLLADIDEVENEKTREMVVDLGGSAETANLDVRDISAWSALAEQLKGDWRHLDLLVNNAGVAGQGDVGALSLDDWEWVLDTSLGGTINGCHTFVPWLKQNPRGAHIINTASLAAFISAPGMAAYNVAKAGVVSLSETLYGELRPYNVGVTVLCPAFFRTRLFERGKFADEAARQIAEQYFLNARLTADDVADAAIRAMHRKRLYVVLRHRAKWFWRAKRFFPKLFHRALAKGYHRHVERLGKRENEK
jgi:short-subunit dehydrogenase